MDYFAGIDIGSTMTKVLILNQGVIVKVVGPTGPEHRRLANCVMEQALSKAGIVFEAITYVVSTGYGRINVPFADRQFTEITCHAKGVAHLFPQAKTVIDIGGQDIKVIKVDKGRSIDFVMNDKCAAGSGRFIEVIADALGVPLEDVGDRSLQSTNDVKISNICTLYAQQELVANLARGVPVADLLAGVHHSLAGRISSMVARLKIEDAVIVTGGGAKNRGLLKALTEELGHTLLIPEEPLLTGALGAALLGRDIFEKAKLSHTPLQREERKLSQIEIL